jgi:hypothetical protein
VEYLEAGFATGQNGEHLDETLAQVDARQRPAAALVLLTIAAPHRVDARCIAAFAAPPRVPERTIGALAWASFTAARHIGARLVRFATVPHFASQR